MKREEIGALVLAAGYSSRMGTFKPLLPVGPVTAIERAVSCFLKAGITDVTVVVGYRADEIVPVLESSGVKWVFNHDFSSGMLSSVLRGIGSLAPHVRAFFMLPCDIPLVEPETIKSLIASYLCGSAPPVIYPVHRGRRGHPPLISRDCVSDLTPAQEGGMRSFLHRFKDEAVDVEVADEGILIDFDTPEDYRGMQPSGL
jgi:CTP:molybdopterin cytidylyltransferase MocA